MLKINSPYTILMAVIGLFFFATICTSCSNGKDLPKYVPDDSNVDLPGYLYEDQMRAADDSND